MAAKLPSECKLEKLGVVGGSASLPGNLVLALVYEAKIKSLKLLNSSAYLVCTFQGPAEQE
jgi:hypothetical protein